MRRRPIPAAIGRFAAQWLVAATATIASSLGQTPEAAARLEFFENRIRPILVDSCYECHSTHGKQKGDVALDHRDGMRGRGSQGAVVVPGQPERSVLMMVLRHEIEDLEMPADAPRLRDEVIADFERWIRDGAVDPRDAPPSKQDLAAATAWPQKLAHRRKWWSLQPVVSHDPPPDEGWSPHPVDRFVAAEHKARQLQRAAPADRRTLLRRLSYALTGLPPSPEELREFEQDRRPDAYARAVDRLLDSPHYGEHWARHWMDVVRYADSHGSEGDPEIPYAYRYRDYLIRAFNQDVPYDQLIREHIAGDLLEEPRIDHERGVVESVLGAAHWRFVFHGYLPTEPLHEKVRFVDDQINVLGKAFLGQTIACARCHDHKFDAISQADYYAIFGVLSSCRPGIHDANTQQKQQEHQRELRTLKQTLRQKLASSWQRHADEQLVARLRAPHPEVAADHPGHLLHEVDRRIAEGATFAQALRQVLSQTPPQPNDQGAATKHLEPGRGDGWYAYGNGLPETSSQPGDFAVGLDGDRLLRGIYPRGSYTHLLSTRHRGVLHSRRFDIESDQVAWGLVLGSRAQLRCVVQDYPRSGLTFARINLNKDVWQWRRMDLTYWQGDRAHFELTTNGDAPVEAGNQDRSYFGLREIRVQPKDAPPPKLQGHTYGLLASRTTSPPADRAALVEHLRAAITAALARWAAGTCTDQQALLLDACLRHGWLPNTQSALADAFETVERYRAIEARVPKPTHIVGLLEADAADHALFVRGDPDQQGETIPRRFLEVLGATRYAGPQSGRRALAEDLANPNNPLTARVMVNRIWHHLFGRGLVATPDNFGHLGAKPTHPALLDHLAARFLANGWSIKDTVRYLITSKTWQLSATSPTGAEAADPEGVWLTHARTRRLTAEALRDSLFATAGALQHELYGRPFGANGDTPRRSVYVRARRNDMDTFLAAFDAPTPFAPVGARLTTNVPAQSLAMLNAPMVWDLARRFARQTADLKDRDERLARMFEAATGRIPTPPEVEAVGAYLRATEDAVVSQQARRQQVTETLAAARQQRAAILDPVRARLVADRQPTAASNGPSPLAAWDFREGPEDLIGELDGELRGSATLDARGLKLDGRGWFATPAIRRDLHEKTLEAWLQLDGLDQTGGGVVTVQDLAGDAFDAIVYGEREARRWIAGSDHFRRTQDVAGAPEQKAATEPVHLAITYKKDGEVTIYREGQPYGVPYQASVTRFAADNAQVLVGLRHGHHAGDRALRGHVLEARLYDRALTPGEVAASANGMPFVREQEILAQLTPSVRRHLAGLSEQVATAERQLAGLDAEDFDQDPWTLVAHALFNLKEFQYIR